MGLLSYEDSTTQLLAVTEFYVWEGPVPYPSVPPPPPLIDIKAINPSWRVPFSVLLIITREQVPLSPLPLCLQEEAEGRPCRCCTGDWGREKGRRCPGSGRNTRLADVGGPGFDSQNHRKEKKVACDFY